MIYSAKGYSFFLLALFLLTIPSIQSKTVTKNWNSSRSYTPFQYATYEGIKIDNESDSLQYDYLRLDEGTDNFYLTFRAKNYHSNPYKKYYYFNSSGKRRSVENPAWGFFLTTPTDTLVYMVKANEAKSDIESQPVLDVTLYDLRKGYKKSETLNNNINQYDGDNLWSIDYKTGICKVAAGDRSMKEISSYKIPRNKVTGFGFISGWGANILVSDINAEFQEEARRNNSSEIAGILPSDNYSGKSNHIKYSDQLPQSNHINKKFSVVELKEYLANSIDPMEGYWVIFDRELDESLLKMGGHYTLACVKDGEDYVLLYLEGATVNKTGWTTGDTKAYLKTSPFEGIYDVEWLDAMKEPMGNDIKAQLGEGMTITMQFPYQASQIRLRKIP